MANDFSKPTTDMDFFELRDEVDSLRNPDAFPVAKLNSDPRFANYANDETYLTDVGLFDDNIDYGSFADNTDYGSQFINDQINNNVSFATNQRIQREADEDDSMYDDFMTGLTKDDNLLSSTYDLMFGATLTDQQKQMLAARRDDEDKSITRSIGSFTGDLIAGIGLALATPFVGGVGVAGTVGATGARMLLGVGAKKIATDAGILGAEGALLSAGTGAAIRDRRGETTNIDDIGSDLIYGAGIGALGGAAFTVGGALLSKAGVKSTQKLINKELAKENAEIEATALKLMDKSKTDIDVASTKATKKYDEMVDISKSISTKTNDVAVIRRDVRSGTQVAKTNPNNYTRKLLEDQRALRKREVSTLTNSKTKMVRLQKEFKELALDAATLSKNGLNSDEALYQAAINRKLFNSVDEMGEEVSSQFKKLDISEEDYLRFTNMSTLNALKLARKTSKRGFVRKTIDKGIGVVSTRVTNMSAALGGKLRRAEIVGMGARGEGNAIHVGLRALKTKINKVDKEDTTKITMALNNDGVAGLEALIKGSSLSMGNELKEETLDLLKKAAKYNEDESIILMANPKIKKIESYYPRVVKASKVKERAERIVNAEDTFAVDETDILNQLNKRNISVNSVGAMKERTKGTLTSRNIGDYEDFDDAMGISLEALSRAKSRQQMFAVDGEIAPFDESLHRSILRLTTDAVKRGELLNDNVKEVGEILTARFGKGEVAPHKTMQWVSGLTQATLMGQVTSALVQFGDMAYPIFKHGLWNTIKGIKGFKELGINDVGLQDMLSAELRGSNTPHDLVRKIFQLNGLTFVDEAVKGVNLRASRVALKRQLSTPIGQAKFLAEFKNSWSQGELFDIIDDVKNGVQSRGVLDIYTSRLLDAQPVARSESTEFLLNNPNGRFMGTIKAFMFKQFDIMRRSIFDATTKEEAARQLLRYTLATVAVNGAVGWTISELKATSFSGNYRNAKGELQSPFESTITPDMGEVMFNTFLRNIALSSYMIDRLGKTSSEVFIDGKLTALPAWALQVSGAVVENIISPAALGSIESWAGDARQLEEDYRIMRKVPVMGDLIERMLMGGAERNEENYLSRESTYDRVTEAMF